MIAIFAIVGFFVFYTGNIPVQKYEYVWNRTWDAGDAINNSIMRLSCDVDDSAQDCWNNKGIVISNDIGEFGYDYEYNSGKTMLWAIRYNREKPVS